MASTFHWVRVKAICYATEDEDLICDTVSELTGSEELDIDISEGLHHTQFLGTSLEQIAMEKAGIIKKDPSPLR